MIILQVRHQHWHRFNAILLKLSKYIREVFPEGNQVFSIYAINNFNKPYVPLALQFFFTSECNVRKIKISLKIKHVNKITM